jgi:protoheme IX farnesyltransferase
MISLLPGKKAMRTLRFLKVLCELARFRVTLAVSVTTLTGYLLFSGHLSADIMVPLAGLFLLASGASALNQLQEYRYDARMSRTMQRPIPARQISRPFAVFFSVLLLSAGSLLLYAGSGLKALLLGWLAFAWYNIVYTYLKRISAFAVIPGSLVGSIPPLIGWIVAGGRLDNYLVLPIIGFFFIWQVPHFWLLVLKYGKEYEAAGLPTLSLSRSNRQISRIIFSWILLTAIVTASLPFTGLLHSFISRTGVVLAAIILVTMFAPLLSVPADSLEAGKYFKRINYFVLAVVVFMSLDRIVFAGLI